MNAPQVVLKRCSCGKVYDREHWEALPLVGPSRMDWGEVQELRNCVCGSTIAIVLEEGEQQDPVVGDIWKNKTIPSRAATQRIKISAVDSTGVAYRYLGKRARGFMPLADFYRSFTPVRRAS